MGQASCVLAHISLSDQLEALHRVRHLPAGHSSQGPAQPRAQGRGGPQREGHHQRGAQREGSQVRNLE